MDYKEFFGLTSTSPQDLRNVAADYLLDLGKTLSSEVLRKGLRELTESSDGFGKGDGTCRSRSNSDDGVGEGDGFGYSCGIGDGSGSPYGCGWGAGTGSGGLDSGSS